MRLWRSSRTVAVGAVPALLVAWWLSTSTVAAPAATPGGKSSSCAIEDVERVVAIGDVHGAYDRFVAILQAAGLIDGRSRWSGGRTHLVQTGDVLDRGPESRKVLDLLRRLEADAERAGGRVHALLGNHEVMRMLGDLRYVSEGEYAAFRTNDSEELRERFYKTALTESRRAAGSSGQPFDEKAFRERFLKETPLGWVEMRIAFGREGEYGRWLREHDAVARINGVVFLHGGISPATAELGCATINETIHEELTSGLDKTRVKPLASLAAGAEGPLWYRGLAVEDEATFGPQIDAILSRLGARAIVIGHTVSKNGMIGTRFGGKVFQIDTGMLVSHYPGGAASALEIRNGQTAAIYADRREVLAEAGRQAAGSRQ